MLYTYTKEARLNVTSVLRNLEVQDVAKFSFFAYQGVTSAIARLQREGKGQFSRVTSDDRKTITVTRIA